MKLHRSLILGIVGVAMAFALALTTATCAKDDEKADSKKLPKLLELGAGKCRAYLSGRLPLVSAVDTRENCAVAWCCIGASNLR